MKIITKILLCGISLITLTACTSPQSKEHFFDPKTDKVSSQSTVESSRDIINTEPISELYSRFIRQSSNNIESFKVLEERLPLITNPEEVESEYTSIENTDIMRTSERSQLKSRKTELTDEQLSQVEDKFKEYQTEYQKVIKLFPNHP